MSKSASAWVDVDGSPAAFVYADGFSAVRDSRGAWKSPAPSVTIGDLSEDGYKLAPPDVSAALVKAARMASSVSPVRAK